MKVESSQPNSSKFQSLNDMSSAKIRIRKPSKTKIETKSKFYREEYDSGTDRLVTPNILKSI